MRRSSGQCPRGGSRGDDGEEKPEAVTVERRGGSRRSGGVIFVVSRGVAEEGSSTEKTKRR
jgi:hypothetical protein